MIHVNQFIGWKPKFLRFFNKGLLQIGYARQKAFFLVMGLAYRLFDHLIGGLLRIGDDLIGLAFSGQQSFHDTVVKITKVE